MALSQEDRQKFEKDFRYLVDKYIEFLSTYNQLLSCESRTPEQEQQLQSMQKLILNIGEVLSNAMQALGDDLFGKAVDLYYHFKDAALAGDTAAQEVVKELKPMFEATLTSRINKN
jgi:hypothetical protein